MSVIVGRRKKIFVAIALSVVVLLAVGLGLIFGLKGSEFAWALENLDNHLADANAFVNLDGESKQITLKDLKEGDSFSFDVKLQNPTAENYNYRLTMSTAKNTMVSSQLDVDVKVAEEEQDVYGSSSRELRAASVAAGKDETIKVTVTAGADLTGLGDSVLKIGLKAISETEDRNASLSSEYSLVNDKEYLEDGFEVGGNMFLSGVTAEGEESYQFAQDLVLKSGRSLTILGDASKTPVIDLGEKTIIVEPGATLELQNVAIKGHIITKTESGAVQSLSARSTSTVSNLILNNVTIYGSEERINKTGTLDTGNTYNNDTKPAVLINEDTKIQIVGNVKVVGNWDASGIGVDENAKVEITGDNLVAIGNGGYEVMGTSNDYYKSKEQVQSLSADAEFSSHLVNDFDQTNNPEAFVVMHSAGTDKVVNKYGAGSGNGIGGIYGNNGDKSGAIYIHDLKSLTAEGYGKHAFGIGGDVSEDIVIENTTIDKVRGGFAVTDITDCDSYYYGNGTDEGGAAIGTINQDFDGTMDTTNPDMPAIAGVRLNEVTINAAYGGHKAAAIGACYWSPAKVIITNSELKNVWGGTYGAGIGGSRIGETRNQDSYIEIVDSNIDVHGGAYAAGIGSGSTVYVRRADDGIHQNGHPQTPKTTINISGNCDIDAVGGIGGAGIGSGYQVGRVYGTIASSVDVSDVHGGGYGDIVSIRGKTTTYNGEKVRVYTYKFGEFAGSGNIWTYYIPVANDGSTPTQEQLAAMDFVGDVVITKPEDIGLGSQCGQWSVSSAQLIATGLADIDHETGELKNTETVERAVEIYNKVFGSVSADKKIPAETAATFTSMQDFVDYAYNTPKGYNPGDANYHVYDSTKDYFVKSGIVVETNA